MRASVADYPTDKSLLVERWVGFPTNIHYIENYLDLPQVDCENAKASDILKAKKARAELAETGFEKV